MADKYGLFWNSVNNDRLYDANSFEEWLSHFFTTGVFADELQVTASSGMDVKVAPGYANLKGKVRFFESVSTLKLETAGATYPRIDTVVIERNDTDRMISVKAVKGAYNGDNPVATAPVRSAAVYQIVLAQVYVPAGATSIVQENITDTRSNTDLCGIVTGTVKEMDYSQFAAQFNAYYDEFKASNKSDFDAWFSAMKNQLTTDAAGNLQTEIDTLKKTVATNTDGVNANKSAIALNKSAIDTNTAKLVTTTKSLTLSSSGWNSGTYTINDSLITATSNQEIIPAVGITSDQYTALCAAQLVDGGQTTGSLTLTALGAVPTIDIPIRVIYRGVK